MAPFSSGLVLLRLTAREMQVMRFCRACSINDRAPGLWHIERNPASRESGTPQTACFMQKHQGYIDLTQTQCVCRTMEAPLHTACPSSVLATWQVMIYVSPVLKSLVGLKTCRHESATQAIFAPCCVTCSYAATIRAQCTWGRDRQTGPG
jgi:hypothetical protein